MGRREGPVAIRRGTHLPRVQCQKSAIYQTIIFFLLDPKKIKHHMADVQQSIHHKPHQPLRKGPVGFKRLQGPLSLPRPSSPKITQGGPSPFKPSPTEKSLSKLRQTITNKYNGSPSPPSHPHHNSTSGTTTTYTISLWKRGRGGREGNGQSREQDLWTSPRLNWRIKYNYYY